MTNLHKAGYEQYLAMLARLAKVPTAAAAAQARQQQPPLTLPSRSHYKQASNRASIESQNSSDKRKFHASPNNSNSLMEVERTLLKEAVRRRLIPNEGDRATAIASHVNVNGGAPFKKRARYSENYEDAAEKSRDEEKRAAEYPPNTIIQRDLALMDRLLARGTNDQAAAQHVLLDSLARVHRGPTRGASHRYLPPAHQAPAVHYPPPTSHHRGTSHAAPAARLHNHSQYAALLSQFATAGQHPAAARPASIATPPVIPTSPPLMTSPSYPGASVSTVTPAEGKPSLLEIKSQFGLSYNDIMNVWRDVHQENTANPRVRGSAAPGGGGDGR